MTREHIKELIETLEKAIGKLGLITIGEAAEIRNTSRSAVLQLIQRGRLETEVIAGKQLVYRTDVENFVNQKPGPAVGTIFNR